MSDFIITCDWFPLVVDPADNGQVVERTSTPVELCDTPQAQS